MMKSTCFPLKSTYFIIFSKVFPQFLGEILWFLWFLWHFSLPNGPTFRQPRHRRARCPRPRGAAARAPAAAAPRVPRSAGARPRGPRRDFDGDSTEIMGSQQKNDHGYIYYYIYGVYGDILSINCYHLIISY